MAMQPSTRIECVIVVQKSRILLDIMGSQAIHGHAAVVRRSDEQRW